VARVRVELDRCGVCQGIYLDNGELRDLTGDRTLAKWLVKHVEFGEPSRLVCPGCQETMESLQPGKVMVEVCRNCHGIWLDWSELEQLGRVTHEELKQAGMDELDTIFEPPGEDHEHHHGPVGLLGRICHKASRR